MVFIASGWFDGFLFPGAVPRPRFEAAYPPQVRSPLIGVNLCSLVNAVSVRPVPGAQENGHLDAICGPDGGHPNKRLEFSVAGSYIDVVQRSNPHEPTEKAL